MSSREKIIFDPKLARLDLPLMEAFRLTHVRSIDDYRLLSSNLNDLRGVSYFFINYLNGKARLMITVIAASGNEVTYTSALKHNLLGISDDDLMNAISGESGNYELSFEIEQKLRIALEDDGWNFFKAE